MSTITEQQRTDNQLHVSYDVSKLALGDNKFIKATYTPSGNTTITEGLVFGRIAATGLLLPCEHGASDGSQFPVGIFYNALNATKTISANVATEITLINKGSVDAGKITFGGSTVITSAVSGGKQMKDYLNDLGIVLETVTELTKIDNA